MTSAKDNTRGMTSVKGVHSESKVSLNYTGLDPAKITDAAAALLKYVGASTSAEKILFQEEEMIFLVVALKQTPKTPKNKHKPIRIPLPHPLYTEEGAKVCLIVKDHKGEGHTAAKKRVKETEGSKVAKVVGLSKLKTKYEAYESKRRLCDEYELFCADERVIPMLPKLLGKTFFKKKKQPIPVDLTKSDWSTQIKKACNATYMYPASGSSLSIRVAKSSFSTPQCAANVAAAIQSVAAHVPKKWSGVQALYLKTADSVSLPIYQTLPSESSRISV